MPSPTAKKQWLSAIATTKGSDRPDLAERLLPTLADRPWTQPLFHPYRYKCLWGGRGSGKSYAIADALLLIGLLRPIRVLCAREFQTSIKESVHFLLAERIEALDLSSFYRIQQTEIVGANGSQFIFKGVRHNVQSIKSMAALTHLWLEEAQTISAESWQVLIPTIREEGSEIWVSFNPLHETDVVWAELVAKTRPNAYVQRVNWDLNPHFPSVLNDERLAMLATDPDAYYHIWEGEFWSQSAAQILNGKWIVEEFAPNPQAWSGPYLGADFGFAQDPSTLIKCWVNDRRLYIERESYQVGLELDHTRDRWLADVPDCDRFTIRADCARPESISYLKRHGLPHIVPVAKGRGSVEDGIAHLRAYDRIIIHPRCTHTANEARLYSWKIDRLSGAILPIPIDAHNHAIDGLRYALQPLIHPPSKGRSPTVMSNW